MEQMRNVELMESAAAAWGPPVPKPRVVVLGLWVSPGSLCPWPVPVDTDPVPGCLESIARLQRWQVLEDSRGTGKILSPPPLPVLKRIN